MVSRETVIAQDAVGIGQRGRIAASVPVQLDGLCFAGTFGHEARDNGMLLHAGLNAVIISGKATVQRVGGAVNGFHCVGAAGVCMVEVGIPLSNDCFPHQRLGGHHMCHFVGIRSILRSP